MWQIFHLSHEFGNWRSSYDFRWVYQTSSSNTMQFLLQRDLIGVCIFWCSCHQCNEHNLNSLIGSLKYLKTLTRDGLKVQFFSLYERVLEYWVFITEMYNWRAPLRLLFFFERLSWTEGVRANLSREKKPFLFCVYEQICIRFRKFSKL